MKKVILDASLAETLPAPPDEGGTFVMQMPTFIYPQAHVSAPTKELADETYAAYIRDEEAKRSEK